MFGVSVVFMGNTEILWYRGHWKFAVKKFNRYMEKYNTEARDFIRIIGGNIKLFVVYDNGTSGLYAGKWKQVLQQISKESPVDYVQIIE